MRQVRDILFRGKRQLTGNWAYGDVAHHDNGHVFIRYCYCGTYTSYEVDPSTVGQYTGLSDSNVLEIFEDDCVKLPDTGDIGVIRYGKYLQPFEEDVGGHIGFFVDWIDGEYKYYLRKDFGYWSDRVEVVGNIHDNPKLLKGGGENG